MSNEKLRPRASVLTTPKGEQLIVLPLDDYAQLVAAAADRLAPEAISDGRRLIAAADPDGPPDPTTARLPGGTVSMEDREELEDVLDHLIAMTGYRSGRAEALTDEEMGELLAAPTPLAFWRKKRGLTQAELASRADIQQAYLSEIESGKKQGSVETLKALARALGVQLDDLAI